MPQHIHGPDSASLRSAGESGSKRAPEFFRHCDFASGFLTLLLVVISPWLFGTTERWSILTLTGGSLLAGVLFIAKKICCRVTGYEPPRWTHTPSWGRWLIPTLGFLTFFILLYCLISAWNARAAFDMQAQQFVYRDNIPWLPASYDALRSWHAFWMYMGLASFFWATWDWMQIKSRSERRSVGDSTDQIFATAFPSTFVLPERMRILLWALCINGALIAVEGLLQRFSGSSKLLWLRESYYQSALTCFGPYSYRSNAAQFFNLIWPISLGLWWISKQNQMSASGRPLRMGEGPHLLLIPATIVMAVAPVITASRGGALVSFALLGFALLLFFFQGGASMQIRLGVALMFAVIAFAGYILGWSAFEWRFKKVYTERLSDRVEIEKNTERMAEDFVWFGSGPGAFSSVYHLYRSDPSQIWQNHLHNDYKETRVTFGVIGYAALLSMLLLALGRWFVPGGVEAPLLFTSMLWLALLGCLTHARFDFPLQVYSILQVFLALCAVLLNLSRPRR
ncbi:MAG: O-antigen ligase family protein [Verrucomicrobiales bacterium]